MAHVTKLLVRNFSSTAHRYAIKHVTVVGGGLMGAGIAQVSAAAGQNVALIDVSDDLLKQSQTKILKSVQRVSKKKFADKPEDGKKFVDEVLSRISLSTDGESAVKSTDLVIEAIVEKMEVKQSLFKALDAAAPEYVTMHVIFATNTSALPVSEIASATTRLDRFGGLHFFNPVPMMKLLEVVRIPQTSDDTNEKLVAYGKAVGKVTVQAKDTPGFIVNRLLLPYMTEAFLLLERGDATPRDIDTAMKLGAGYPMGPFELADYVGLDTLKFITDDWVKRFPGEFQQSQYLVQLVNEGKLGVKSGEGVYSYKK